MTSSPVEATRNKVLLRKSAEKAMKKKGVDVNSRGDRSGELLVRPECESSYQLSAKLNWTAQAEKAFIGPKLHTRRCFAFGARRLGPAKSHQKEVDGTEVDRAIQDHGEDVTRCPAGREEPRTRTRSS
uniref:Uncharacterized protein n=1 Tax=Nothobranchius kuhntae TaxID=321403 RepID=A0A1A8IB16_NOTKU